MLKSDNPESCSFRPLQDPLSSTPDDFRDLRPSSLSNTDRQLFFLLLFFAGLFKIFAIVFFICFFLTQLLRPQVLFLLQDGLGLIDPVSQTSILFSPPLVSGPYQLADLEIIKDILENTKENLGALQSSILLVETRFRDLKLKHQRTRRMLPFIDADNGDKIADALSIIVSWGFVESESRIELVTRVQDTIHRLQYPDLSFQSDLRFMWFAFRAGIHSHPYSRLVELEIASRLMVPFLHDLTLVDKKAKPAVQVLDIPLLRRAIARLNGDLSVALSTLSSATHRPIGILPIETQIQMLTTIQREIVTLERGLETMVGALVKLDRICEEAIALGRNASDSKGGA